MIKLFTGYYTWHEKNDKNHVFLNFYTLHKEVVEWLDENNIEYYFPCNPSKKPPLIGFIKDSDAILFKMRW